MRDVIIGQYYPGESVVHRLDPRVKLMGTLVFIVLIFLVDNFIGYALTSLFLFGIICIADIPFSKLLRGIRGILMILILSSLFNLFLTPWTSKNRIFKNNKCGCYKSYTSYYQINIIDYSNFNYDFNY